MAKTRVQNVSAGSIRCLSQRDAPPATCGEPSASRLSVMVDPMFAVLVQQVKSLTEAVQYL